MLLNISRSDQSTAAGTGSDGGVVSSKAGESNLLWEDDIYRVFHVLLAGASSFSQQVFSLLTYELAVLGICHPCLTATKKHDARGAQDDQAGEQGQDAEADELTLSDQDSRRVDGLFQGDLQQVSFGRSEQPVEGVSREGVMLWGQRIRPVVCGPGAAQLGPAPRSVLQGTRETCQPFGTNAAKGSIRLTDTRAPISAGLTSAG